MILLEDNGKHATFLCSSTSFLDTVRRATFPLRNERTPYKPYDAHIRYCISHKVQNMHLLGVKLHGSSNRLSDIYTNPSP